MKYIINDCSCGYATNNTKSCGVKTCHRYIMREIKMAEEEFKFNQEQNFNNFKERCSKAINKEDK